MSDWLVSQLGDLVDFRKGVKVEVFDDRAPGREPYLGASALEGDEPRQFALTTRGVTATPSDILMLWDGERSGLVGGGLRGVVSSTVSRLRPRSATDSAFLTHSLQSRFD